MRAVVTDVQHRRRSGELPVEVGVLTADNRDEWSQVRFHTSLFFLPYFGVAQPALQNYSTLLSISPQNKHSFEAIHQSLFAVSLDHWPAPSVPADQRDENLRLTFGIDQQVSDSLPAFQSSRSSSKVPSDLLSHQYAIRSSPSALNRFFDKPLSLIVEPSTRAGAMGEHSPVDALIPSVVCEWAVAGANGVSICGGLADVPFENIHREDKLEGLETALGSRWTRINFVSSPSIQIAVENAKQHARTLVLNSDHQVSYFEEWGGEEMERVCELPVRVYFLIKGTYPTYSIILARCICPACTPACILSNPSAPNPCIRNSTHPNIPARTYRDNPFIYGGELCLS